MQNASLWRIKGCFFINQRKTTYGILRFWRTSKPWSKHSFYKLRQSNPLNSEHPTDPSQPTSFPEPLVGLVTWHTHCGCNYKMNVEDLLKTSEPYFYLDQCGEEKILFASKQKHKHEYCICYHPESRCHVTRPSGDFWYHSLDANLSLCLVVLSSIHPRSSSVCSFIH